MKMTLMGTGTSHGVPVITCNCAVCRSSDVRDNRLRCSAYISEPEKIIIDTGPDFRTQALKYGVSTPKAVFLTHSHADHLNGLDDLRIFSHTRSIDKYNKNTETDGDGLKVYANANTIQDTKTRFDYIFMPVKEGGGKPKLQFIDCSCFTKDSPLQLGSLKIVPIPILHGTLQDMGYLFVEQSATGVKHGIAYLTDCNFVPKESLLAVKESCDSLDHLVIDGLRLQSHSTHFSFEEALTVANELSPKNTWLTHITHDLSFVQISEFLLAILDNFPNLKVALKNGGKVSPAFDGLILKTDLN